MGKCIRPTSDERWQTSQWTDFTDTHTHIRLHLVTHKKCKRNPKTRNLVCERWSHLYLRWSGIFFRILLLLLFATSFSTAATFPSSSVRFCFGCVILFSQQKRQFFVSILFMFHYRCLLNATYSRLVSCSSRFVGLNTWCSKPLHWIMVTVVFHVQSHPFLLLLVAFVFPRKVCTNCRVGKIGTIFFSLCVSYKFVAEKK